MNDITLCITIGKRPDLLKKTLQSLFANTTFSKVIAVNDFGDQQTNEVFKNICPDGNLLSLDKKLGHHAAVDLMYKNVDTPYVFHCEDDWLFEKPIELVKIIETLKKNTWMSGICLRSLSDFTFSSNEAAKIIYETHNNLSFYRLDKMHEQWYGFTFNPHVASIDLWRKFSPLSSHKKERYISRTIRKAGLVICYLEDGGCLHIGEGRSVSLPRKNNFLHKLFKLLI